MKINFTKIIVLLSIWSLWFQSFSNNFKGFDVMDDKAFYVSDTDLNVYDLKTHRVIQSKCIMTDKSTIDALIKVAKTYAYKDVTKSTFQKTGTVINITARQYEVLLVFGFVQTKPKGQKVMRYAVLSYDHQLNLKNYYSIKSDTSYTKLNFLPYFPLKFKDSNTFYLQYYQSGMRLGAFKMNPKGHVIVKTNDINQTTLIGKEYKVNYTVSDEMFVSPVFNFLVHTDTLLYYLHPYPVLFGSGFIQLNDTFHQRKNLNTLYRTDIKDNSFFNFSRTLNKELLYMRYAHTNLSMSMSNDTVIFLITDVDKSKVNVLKMNTKGTVLGFRKIQLAEPGWEIVSKGDVMYQLIIKDKQTSIHRYEL